MRNHLLLLLLTDPPQSPYFLLHVSRHHQQCLPFTRPLFTPVLTKPFISVKISPRIQAKNRRWDSNAEDFSTQNFNFSSFGDYNEDDDEDDDDEVEDMSQWSDVLEDFIDEVWIFKVFRSFGWMLPAIISSLLLATGPKAFLFALALPLGQSALSFAFQKVWGNTKGKRKRKAKTRKKPRASTASKFDVNEAEKEEVLRNKREKMGYKSWVGGDDVSAKQSTQNSPSYGGWDQLNMRDVRGTSNQAADEKQKASSRSKLSRRERRATPLLLRLLIAVFPFLASWTRLL